MAARTILVIRHAEKPDADGDGGVDATGTPDRKSLTPRGWQRAGAWAELFVPSLGTSQALPRPTVMFASAPSRHTDLAARDGGSKSRRPLETISPLAHKLGIEIDLRFAKGEESDLAKAISAIEGVVLVCWQHEDIAAIANALAPRTQGIPQHWPGDCFNVVFKFTRPDDSSPWDFQQIVPVMLAGDNSAPIPR